jgi:hypothetical protein
MHKYIKLPNIKNLACILLINHPVMLTRREVLAEFKRLGMETSSSLKNSLRDFEKYMESNHGVEIVKTRKEGLLLAKKYQSDQNVITPSFSQTERKWRLKGSF